MNSRWRPLAALWGALALKGALLAGRAVPFNSDEAIVALMARHILRGERPWFFYGQAYMGSLDAYLIAGAFRLGGERVLMVRFVQAALFALFLATGYRVALRFSGSPRVALLALLLLAFPPVLLTLYTTATLGGYGEALLLGNLLLWWGHRLGREDARRRALWLAWGLVGGLGFWAFGLVLVYLVPVGLWLLTRRPRPGDLSLAALGFLVGSGPWWLGNLGRFEAGVAELLGVAVSSTATAGGFLGNVAMRTFNFIVLGLPVLFGLRFPWSVAGPPLWMAAPVLVVYLGALAWGGRRWREYPLLWGVWAALFLGFVLTPFGGDPSGRYFLPLYLPLTVFAAGVLSGLPRRWGGGLLAAILLFNLTGVTLAARANPPGLTTQFEAITQVDHRYDAALMDFLRAHDGRRGYGNYWVAYPIAFLSREEIILIPRLPYKADLRYTLRDDRYAPYDEMVAASPAVVYVTTNNPLLDRSLRVRLREAGVSCSEAQIGDYHVFYDLSRRVTPEELTGCAVLRDGCW